MAYLLESFPAPAAGSKCGCMLCFDLSTRLRSPNGGGAAHPKSIDLSSEPSCNLLEMIPAPLARQRRPPRVQVLLLKTRAIVLNLHHYDAVRRPYRSTTGLGGDDLLNMGHGTAPGAIPGPGLMGGGSQVSSYSTTIPNCMPYVLSTIKPLFCGGAVCSRNACNVYNTVATGSADQTECSEERASI